jgi:hypothetical protein
MILGFKQPPMGDPYQYGKINGVNKKLCRVLVGACLPIFGQGRGAIVALGEIYRASSPPEWYVLGATTGAWPRVERALAEYRRNLKFNIVVSDSDEARTVIGRIPGLKYGQGTIPLLSYTAPREAFSEAGRQRVNSLASEGRVHLDDWKHVVDSDPGPKALQSAVIWADQNPAPYRHKQKSKQPEYKKILGTTGL